MDNNKNNKFKQKAKQNKLKKEEVKDLEESYKLGIEYYKDVEKNSKF